MVDVRFTSRRLVARSSEKVGRSGKTWERGQWSEEHTITGALALGKTTMTHHRVDMTGQKKASERQMLTDSAQQGPRRR